MNDTERTTAISDCQRLSIAFCNHLDARRYEALAALFAPDGVFERAGNPVTGPAAIQAEMSKRPPDMATMHVTGNIQIDLTDDTHADGVTYYFVLMQTKVTGNGPFPMPGMETAGMFIDKFVRTPQGWRLALRRATGVFRREAPAPR
jgi:hypothetical protein